MRQAPLLLRLRLSIHTPAQSSVFSHDTWRAFIIPNTDTDHLQPLSDISWKPVRQFENRDASSQTHLDVRMVFASGAPLSRAPLFFAVFVELWVA